MKPYYLLLLFLLLPHCNCGSGSTTCNPNAAHGQLGACCGPFQNQCVDGQNCTDNGCQPCGQPGQMCCNPGPICATTECTGMVGSTRTCSGTTTPRCGADGQPCCHPTSGDQCNPGVVCNVSTGHCQSGGAQCTGGTTYPVAVVSPEHCLAALVLQQSDSAADALTCVQGQYPGYTVSAGTDPPVEHDYNGTTINGCTNYQVTDFSEADGIACVHHECGQNPDCTVSTGRCP